MAPPTKRQKTQSARYLCRACNSIRASKQFPKCNPASTCNHNIHTCTSCLKKWCKTKINDADFKPAGKDGKEFAIDCPECDQLMLHSDVEQAATQRDFKRFVELERNNIAEKTPGWRWCLNSNCKEGQVHNIDDANDTVATAPVKRYADRETEGFVKYGRGRTAIPGAEICQCKTCGAQACVPCDRPWHEGETCEAFQERSKHHIEEEDKTLQTIEAISKRCPNCQNKIQKNGGCEKMYCACGAAFCWECLHEIGTDDIYCKCHPDA